MVGARITRTPSASTDVFDRQDLARVRRMTVLERMVLCLELGRRGRAIRQRLKQTRRVDSSG
jgi:hypothetical protein